MDPENLEARVTEMINQQSDRITQVLNFIEELRQQQPQYPPGFPPLPQGNVSPPAAAALNQEGVEDWFNGVPPPTIDKRIQDKMDKVDKLESVLRKSINVYFFYSF